MDKKQKLSKKDKVVLVAKMPEIMRAAQILRCLAQDINAKNHIAAEYEFPPQPGTSNEKENWILSFRKLPSNTDGILISAQNSSTKKLKALTPEQRLKRIALIIEQVDNRCMAVDGPVTKTLDEMTQKEISEIYELSIGMKAK